jgi:ketopantoate reductase
MPRIVLIGPGAIGGLVAAWLCQDDRNQVMVCARTPIQCLQLETSDGVIEARPKVLTRPEKSHTADWILVATKAYDSGSAVAWRKLCINAAGAVNALTLEPARIANEPHAEMVMRKLVLEAVAVGRAEGANLEDSVADEVVYHYQNVPGDSVNSLHADRLAARPMEIDLRNGVIARLGHRHGISTPFNEMAVALLESVS